MDAKDKSAISKDMMPLLNFMSSFFGNNPRPIQYGQSPVINKKKLSFFNKVMQSSSEKKQFCSGRGKQSSPEKKRYGAGRGRQLYSEDEKVNAVVRIKTMGYTKAEVARDLNVAESTLRGWFKNKKIATEAETVCRRLLVDWSAEYSFKSLRLGIIPEDPVPKLDRKRQGRHKQLNPKKLQTVSDRRRDEDFWFHWTSVNWPSRNAVTDNEIIIVSNPPFPMFAFTSNGLKPEDYSDDDPFENQFADGSSEPQPLDLSTRSRCL